MLTDVQYHGCRIVWDARREPGAFFWTGKAAVVLPADALGVKRIHRITGSNHWLCEEDARDELIHAAREWIDDTASGHDDSRSSEWNTSGRPADL